MAVRSFQARLLFLLIAVLVLLQAATLVSVHLAGQRALRRSVADELRVGSRVFDRVLTTRARRLSDNVRAITLDFPFREAIASADVATISSVLANHGSRINADAVLLIGLDGVVTADTLGGRMAGKPFPFATLLRTAEERGEASATVSFGDRLYQFVIVPVLLPRPIAWVCAGFEVDEAVLNDVRGLTSLDISIWRGGSRAALLSTLTGAPRADLAARASSLPAGGELTMPLANERYASLIEPLHTGDGSHATTLLQLALDEAGRPFTTLELQIFTLSSIALLAAIVAALFFSRTVSRPLQILAEGAGRIERGDYSHEIVVGPQDEIGHLAKAFNQMRAAIAAREEQITYQAGHDALTKLPNRALFLDRLRQAIASARRSGACVGMAMMDVDRFKEINDTLGHNFGDQLLIDIGQRLERAMRDSDSVARLGGDEFALTFALPAATNASEIATRVSTVFEAPFVLGEVAIDVNASIGIAVFPEHAGDAETLMKRADIAMYEAKKNRTFFAIYEAGRDEHSLRRLALMMELRQAITRDELELYYQPKVNAVTERVVHAEALVRWNHARHGVMRPDEFIPLAEQAGNISLITKWVLRRAIADCARWNSEGLDLCVAVNLSALDLFDSELPTFISGVLSENGLSPKRLMLEITESAVMKDPAFARRILRELKQRGATLAIDDFGTGYSSLAHLKRLPVDELKIDKSFVQNLSERASDDLVIVRSTIELGHNMGLTVVAEGVETAEAWQVLKRLGCDLGQGYFMSRPLPEASFREWFAVRETLP
ncbi:MAG TPA: EAL domain-containing protein [Thermoanaerobaculia bacterium]|jgi:diguanylate cyclase (GGDEF)-like protein